MRRGPLRFVVRTPKEVVFDQPARSLRAPTETGQVGLRPGVEPLVLAIEAGLVVARTDDAYRFVGTAGGLLRCDGSLASLLTPLAVSGGDEAAVLNAREEVLAQPSEEMEARETLARLQRSILRELRQTGRAPTNRAEGLS